MEIPIKFTLLSLTVLSYVKCKDITVTGYEGGNAVIDCPSQEGFESNIKYLLKGEFKDGVEVIQSTGRNIWTHKERVSLQDKRDRHIFTVTIRKLTPEDAGIYGCGVKRWKEDLYTRVKLTVVRKPNNPTAAIPKVTAEDTVALPSTLVSTHNTTTRWLSNITESERTKHFQSDPTSAASGGHLAYLSGGLVVAVVIIALLVVTVRLIQRRAEKNRALPTPLSGNTRPDSCVYSEIQPLHASDGPNQSDQQNSPALTSVYTLATHPAPAQHHVSAKAANKLPQPPNSDKQAANHLPQPTTGGDDIYYLATNQHCESGPATAITGSDDIYSLATNPTPFLQTGASASLATNHKLQFDPANYSSITLAKENPDGSEYETVVFSDEPIASDSASVSFSKCGPFPKLEMGGDLSQ
ncbi:CMRF35-like molecule 1 [Sardina pilchardus]|uniref:CMRF35-like molecule 1 n=1 Tax=Sardina pilchardus TaxID=27697 RepID=UPI002E0DED3A